MRKHVMAVLLLTGLCCRALVFGEQIDSGPGAALKSIEDGAWAGLTLLPSWQAQCEKTSPSVLRVGMPYWDAVKVLDHVKAYESTGTFGDGYVSFIQVTPAATGGKKAGGRPFAFGSKPGSQSLTELEQRYWLRGGVRVYLTSATGPRLWDIRRVTSIATDMGETTEVDLRQLAAESLLLGLRAAQRLGNSAPAPAAEVADAHVLRVGTPYWQAVCELDAIGARVEHKPTDYSGAVRIIYGGRVSPAQNPLNVENALLEGLSPSERAAVAAEWREVRADARRAELSDQLSAVAGGILESPNFFPLGSVAALLVGEPSGPPPCQQDLAAECDLARVGARYRLPDGLWISIEASLASGIVEMSVGALGENDDSKLDDHTWVGTTAIDLHKHGRWTLLAP